MKMQWIVFVLMVTSVGAQTGRSFDVQVGADTVLLGGSFEVRFTAYNINGTFEPPSFDGFRLVGGPSQSTSMSFVNGVSMQNASYSYFLEPLQVGVPTIPPAYYVTSDTTWETRPLEIYCLPNPEGKQQDSRIDAGPNRLEFPSLFGRSKPHPAPRIKKKKKLKETKI